MIDAFVLCHPQSANYITKRTFAKKFVKPTFISCGTTHNAMAMLSESNDFSPSYSSWNSVLFESSVILTTWRHIDELANDNVAVMHTDIRLNFRATESWQMIDRMLKADPYAPIGLSIPIPAGNIIYSGQLYTPANDPMQGHLFDGKKYIWDIIKELDEHALVWAYKYQPQLIYTHQFACSKDVYKELGDRLYPIIANLRLKDVGLWTPHVFERLIAIYLAMIAAEHGTRHVLTNVLNHKSSSAPSGPGQHKLYGVRPFRYFKV